MGESNSHSSDVTTPEKLKHDVPQMSVVLLVNIENEFEVKVLGNLESRHRERVQKKMVENKLSSAGDRLWINF